ncbi:hypothetical protein DE146DRAFT_658138 [Phaeosphaeria sp. MPI-PUGE-AT-0046c]|nr:hypothetical protein DE146DRAFT_658138 [Phaeosphaeria sp. MPI-PUGE-AT-0046c]
MVSYLQQLEQNVCAMCSLPIFGIDQNEHKNCGTFIHPCKHLVCHSCLLQHAQKEKACRLLHPAPFPQTPRIT